MDLATWTEVLGLPAVEVVAVERGADGKGWLLSVISTNRLALCPQCKRPSGARHLTRWETIHDLPAFGQDIRLKMQVLQFQCQSCYKFFTVHPVCVLETMHVTARLAEALTDGVNVSTLRAAAATYHLAERTAKEIYEKIVARRRQQKAQTLQPLTKLGVDEIHLEVHDNSPAPPAAANGAPPLQPPPAEDGGKISRG